jgi:4-hydroxy-3-polyprenylbenzoate decarboxylase
MPEFVKKDDLSPEIDDIRGFIRRLEKEGDLVRIEKEVEGGDEIASIMWELEERKGNQAPAIIFEKIKGFDIPVVKNLYGSLRRWALILGFPDWRNIKIKELKNYLLQKIESEKDWIAPEIIGKAPCQEMVNRDNPDFSKFPIFRWHPTDGGPYITLPGVIMKDPEWGQNLGMYRIMIVEGKAAPMVINSTQDSGIYCARARKRGVSKVDCAIAIGFDPLLYLASVMKMPVVGRDAEFRFVGGLLGKPVPLTKCVTVDIDVPASSEIVFEGYIDLDDVREEGPYGEYTGYYGEKMVQPTFHLKCVTHRKSPYYVSCTSAHEASECLILHYPQPFSWYRRMKTEVVGFRDAYLPLQGRNFIAIVQINKRYPGWGKQAIMSALGSGFAAAIINWLVVVDEDIDIYNWDQVLFALATRVDPQLDIVTFPPLAVNALNPSARSRIPESKDFPYTNFALCSKVGIDATKKFSNEPGRQRPTPPLSLPDREVLKKVRKQWKEYKID